MSLPDDDTLFYIILIAVFLGFFLWNRSQAKKRRENRKDRSFRERYNERKKRNK